MKIYVWNYRILRSFRRADSTAQWSHPCLLYTSHNALEIVCVTNGALELGVGQELYHMEKGDIGFVFPDIIHHYQVLTPGVNTAIYLIASPFVISKFADIMQSMAPEYPIIRRCV